LKPESENHRPTTAASTAELRAVRLPRFPIRPRHPLSMFAIASATTTHGASRGGWADVPCRPLPPTGDLGFT